MNFAEIEEVFSRHETKKTLAELELALGNAIEIIKEDRELLLWLDCLDEAGVDNWSGIEYAQDLLRDYQKEMQ